MADAQLVNDINTRRTFAIISHPDAGKTTITEKLILLGQLIQVAGTVKGKKHDKSATSDWMTLEKERGISVTSSVMQFPYKGRTVNLLDTPGHEDFSEDTYRTLTAVDSALMVIDGAKGVEARTIKLMNVCRLRDTPIVSFVNKLDREIRGYLEEAFGSNLVFDADIDSAVAHRQCTVSGQTIIELEPGSKSARQYIDMTREVMARLGMGEERQVELTPEPAQSLPRPPATNVSEEVDSMKEVGNG